jgi:hypothetical protein
MAVRRDADRPALVTLEVVLLGDDLPAVVDQPLVCRSAALPDQLLDAAAQVHLEQRRQGPARDVVAVQVEDRVAAVASHHRHAGDNIHHLRVRDVIQQRPQLVGSYVEHQHLRPFAFRPDESHRQGRRREGQQQVLVVGPFDRAQLLVADPHAADGVIVLERIDEDQPLIRRRVDEGDHGAVRRKGGVLK